MQALIDAESEPLEGRLFRVVESQEQVATNHLVDTLEEQHLLEDLLEESKPPRLPGSEQLHYLLATPFRYPPLPWGSRFGRPFEPGIFYASLQLEAGLAETAYYRFLFWEGMSASPLKPLSTQHHVFAANYRVARGLRLQSDAWLAHHEALTHPKDYAFCQQLGTDMREQGIQAFEFLSARALQIQVQQGAKGSSKKVQGLNIGLFDPAALSSKRPLNRRRLLVDTSQDSVTMRLEQDNGQFALYQFQRQHFLLDGKLPMAAN